jgi:translation initiation factor IF-1
LANGHELTAFVPGQRRAVVKFVPGDAVELQLTPYDLSTGRVLTEIERFKYESSRVSKENV